MGGLSEARNARQHGAFGVTRAIFAALALVGAGLLAAAEFSTLYEVEVGTLNTVLRTVPGHDNHAYALLVVAVAAAVMAFGAWRGARPAAAALVVLGVVALAVALALDLPNTSGTGKLPEAVTFEDAGSRPGVGLYLELAGGALIALAGAGLLARGRGPRRRSGGTRKPKKPREPREPAEPAPDAEPT